MGSKCSSFQNLTRFQPYKPKYVVENHEKDICNLCEFDALRTSFSSRNLVLRPLWRRQYCACILHNALQVSISTAVATQEGWNSSSILINCNTLEHCGWLCHIRSKFQLGQGIKFWLGKFCSPKFLFTCSKSNLAVKFSHATDYARFSLHVLSKQLAWNTSWH